MRHLILKTFSMIAVVSSLGACGGGGDETLTATVASKKSETALVESVSDEGGPLPTPLNGTTKFIDNRTSVRKI